MDWTTILLGTAAGGVTLFFWLGLVWMVLKHHDAEFQGVPDPEALEAGMNKLDNRRAFYCLPFMGDYEGGQKDPALAERMKKGPNALVISLPRGNCMQGTVFLRGFLLNLFDAFCLAVLCTLLPESGLLDKVMLGAGMGAFLGISAYAGMSNWMFMPWRFAWTSVFDRVVGFALVGLALHLCGVGPVG